MSNDIEQAKQFLAALREAGSIVWVDDEDCLLISPPFTAVEGYGDGEDLEGAIDRHYYSGAEFGVQRDGLDDGSPMPSADTAAFSRPPTSTGD